MGERFLEKIVQIKFPIPRPNREIVQDFVLSSLGIKVDDPREQEAVEEKAKALREKVDVDHTYTSIKQIQININAASPNIEIGNSNEKRQQEQAEQRVLGEIILKDFDNLEEVGM